MSNNNDSGKFFKFKNLQLVRKQNLARQTQQNTDLRMQGTAEEQFAAITAAARADALREIDNLSSDDESVDYLPPEQQPLEPQVQVRNNGQQISDSDETCRGITRIHRSPSRPSHPYGRQPHSLIFMSTLYKATCCLPTSS